MVTDIQRIVISGYYGFGNSGDEAVLQSILTSLQEESEQAGIKLEPVVLSADPEWTSRIYGVESVHRMKLQDVISAIRGSEGLISGGGSLLQDVTGWKTIPYYLGIIRLAQGFGKPVFIYSQGIGPVNRPIFHPWIRRIYSRCRYLSVRDQESASLLEHMGLDRAKIEVVPDPVMSFARMNADRAAGSGEPVIGVSVRFWDPDHTDLKGIAEALRQIVSATDARLRFLPFHQPEDIQASQAVIDFLGDGLKGRATLVQGAETPLEMVRQTADCDLLIGMRLHSLIYAASQLVPMVGISYDPKIDHFLRRLGMEPASRTDRPEPGRIAAAALHLLDNSEQWKHQKKEIIENFRTQSRLPAQQIIDYLRNKRVGNR
ncbi:polysaccharide pyruvyl transferase CsaB [Ferviditalea candida]|uniref:Polysaccharide pyruvyl transferase CsaB n=1 Tax=Ferviditalea candida TaxID=3108399 RepID=A0ABU5ZJ13_9BACL|nr:polysaccharide pyruvyl transferase CsaB [Paenibacillaceae bacterium T2]